MGTRRVGADLRALAERALAHWDLAGARIEPVNVGENVTFRVDKDGRAYVLRIHRSWYHTLDELNSELIWTGALRGAGLDVPEALFTADGRGYVTLPLPGSDETRNVGVLRWVEGDLLGEVIANGSDEATLRGHFEQLGRIAARIHNQSSGWAPPQDFRRHSFDVGGLVGETAFWGPFWDLPQFEPDQRAVIAEARRVIRDALTRYGTSADTYSLIHADLHPYNLVVGERGLHVIDFDDSGFGWHQYELAVALYSYLGHPQFPAIEHALIEGYRAERPLADSALALLPLFFLVRRLVNIGWDRQRPELGSYEYLPQAIEGACSHAESFLGSWQH